MSVSLVGQQVRSLDATTSLVHIRQYLPKFSKFLNEANGVAAPDEMLKWEAGGRTLVKFFSKAVQCEEWKADATFRKLIEAVVSLIENDVAGAIDGKRKVKFEKMRAIFKERIVALNAADAAKQEKPKDVALPAPAPSNSSASSSSSSSSAGIDTAPPKEPGLLELVAEQQAQFKEEQLKACLARQRILAEMATLKVLTHVELKNKHFTTLSGVETLTELRSLILLQCSPLKSEGLAPLIGHKTLQELSLDVQCEVADSNYSSYFAQIPGLKKLNFQPHSAFNKHLSESWSKEFFAPLSSLRNMESLALYPILITDAIMPYLTKFTALQTLDLGFCSISDNGLQLLAALQNLKVLKIGYCGSNCHPEYGPGPNFLAQFPSEDGWINLLDRLPKLEHLSISSSQNASNKILDRLEKMPNLKSFAIGRIDSNVLLERLKDPQKFPALESTAVRFPSGPASTAMADYTNYMEQVKKIRPFLRITGSC